MIECHNCGCQKLEFCAVERVVHYKTINPLTGKFVGQKKKVSDGNDNEECFISCPECFWTLRDGELGYESLIKNINKQDIQKMLTSVNP